MNIKIEPAIVLHEHWYDGTCNFEGTDYFFWCIETTCADKEEKSIFIRWKYSQVPMALRRMECDIIEHFLKSKNENKIN